MISHRLRGLVNLHVAGTMLLAVIYFFAAAIGVNYTPFLSLSTDVNLITYSLPIALGMLLSGRFVSALGSRFHLISWVEAAAIASRQILVVATLIFLLIVATKDRSISRLFLASFLLTCWFLLLWVNRFLPGYLAKIAFHTTHQVPAVFVGPTRALGRLGRWVRQKEHLGIKIVGIVSDEAITATAAPFVSLLGSTAELGKIIEERGIGEVIILEIPDNPATMVQYVEACQSTGARMLVYQNLWERLPIPMVPVIEDEHLFLTIHEEPLEDPFNRGVKRVYDIVVSLPVVTLVLPPLCLLVWLVQCTQAPGPLMFNRPRGGHRRREFRMLKFRSMYVDTTDPRREAQQARPGDARIYPFGRFLRKTSLDEFPQFWNVLVGDMSIVGPRPHLPTHDYEFSLLAKTYRTRQLVKPGITGLAQVSGYRGEISDPELLRRRVQLDIHYITHWSIWLDAQITLQTLLQVVRPPKSAL